MTDEKLVVSLRNSPPAPAPTYAAEPPLRPRRKRRRGRTMLIALILIALVGAVVWYILPGKSASSGKSSTNGSTASTSAATASASAQSANIIAKVGKLIELPQNETPTIATVTDPSKLGDQAFFKNAKAGDIVLIYTAAREAYLYDPVQNKLVEVAPITTSASPTASSSQQ